MKKYFKLLIAFLGIISIWGIYSFVGSSPVETNFQNIDLIKLQKNLKSHVQYLTNLRPSRTSTSVAALDKSAEYIFNFFLGLGLKPEYQIYDVNSGNEIKKYRNVKVLFGDTKKPRVVIGAHYDVCRREIADPAALVPGADDNASGVAGLMELARLLKEEKSIIEDYSVEFVAYSLEEPPYFRTPQMGSFVHASSLNQKKISVKLMISLEMIGYFSNERGSQNYPLDFPMKKIYGDQANFIAVIGEPKDFFILKKVQSLFQAATALPVFKLSAPTKIQGIDWSDHSNYWKFGYPAIMLTDTSFLRNKNYHQVSDTADTLDYEKMAEVVRGMQSVIVNYH